MENRRTAAIVGAGALALVAVFLYLLFLYIGGEFKSGYEVSAEFARAGQLLRTGSDVKMRGVLVGSVRDIEIARSGKARVTMLLQEDQHVPANVHAAIRAKTLFGEKFIDFVTPQQPSSQQLRAGDVIPQDRTTPPIEVETLLEKFVPILESVDPEAFGSSLRAVATALSGNEEALRHATLASEKLLTETERTLPNLERNLVHLKNFASALNQTDTDLLDALDGLTLVGETIRDHSAEFRSTVSGLVPLASDLGDVVTARESDLGDLATKQLAILREVQERKDRLPNLVRVLDGFLGVWVADLSQGPNWRITVTDPPAFTGTPYAPGEAPAPRTATLATLRTDGTAVDDVLGILLEPIPTEDLDEATRPLGRLLGTLR